MTKQRGHRATLPPGVIHLHAASFGATIGPSGDATGDLAASARAAGATVSYDINIRASVLPERDRKPAR